MYHDQYYDFYVPKANLNKYHSTSMSTGKFSRKNMDFKIKKRELKQVWVPKSTN